MKIRQAQHEDLDTVRELWETFYTEWPEPPHRQKGWDDIAGDVERLLLEGGVALLAEEDGDAVGYALGWPRNERVGYVGDLYVQPEFRRRGIGRALLVAAAEGLDREYPRPHHRDAERIRRARTTPAWVSTRSRSTSSSARRSLQ